MTPKEVWLMRSYVGTGHLMTQQRKLLPQGGTITRILSEYLSLDDIFIVLQFTYRHSRIRFATLGNHKDSIQPTLEKNSMPQCSIHLN